MVGHFTKWPNLQRSFCKLTKSMVILQNDQDYLGILHIDQHFGYFPKWPGILQNYQFLKMTVTHICMCVWVCSWSKSHNANIYDAPRVQRGQSATFFDFEFSRVSYTTIFSLSKLGSQGIIRPLPQELYSHEAKAFPVPYGHISANSLLSQRAHIHITWPEIGFHFLWRALLESQSEPRSLIAVNFDWLWPISLVWQQVVSKYYSISLLTFKRTLHVISLFS